MIMTGLRWKRSWLSQVNLVNFIGLKIFKFLVVFEGETKMN